MTFQGVIGQGGYAGWKLLSRTIELQKTLIARDPTVARDNDHFRAKVASVTTADDLVSDYRMLRTALSAFGLERDLPNRFFIRKVLDSDLNDPKSLANRLQDKRYLAFAQAFGLGKGGQQTRGLADIVAERHVEAELEGRVGTLDGNLKLAMNAQRELAALGQSSSSDLTRWYNVLGSPPLRKVFEGALGLGSSFGKMPVDRQVDLISAGVKTMMGSDSPAVFAEPANVEKLISRFLIKAGSVTGTQSSYNAALVLLGG